MGDFLVPTDTLWTIPFLPEILLRAFHRIRDGSSLEENIRHYSCATASNEKWLPEIIVHLEHRSGGKGFLI